MVNFVSSGSVVEGRFSTIRVGFSAADMGLSTVETSLCSGKARAERNSFKAAKRATNLILKVFIPTNRERVMNNIETTHSRRFMLSGVPIYLV
jgi:hypothetical protein